ncbi:hypothetical protein G647_04266 [Cladophialophora carrionii CBS 160.54]|uniref:BZIP domain-containing protein n=1 Tax=Cladophialophora carrionii CBS 160.54 TaxID=1279043 RepID=V9DE09_9EURO|nr:uncharacterized protein G647_04266 [Cladophialophora carrionii CBS 160.54]ETI24896.1 hypothetical protein G647_04266 [Cladophialophora carrionii CBS 160.54]
MALTSEFQTNFGPSTNPWDFELPNDLSYIPGAARESALDDFSGLPAPTLSTLASERRMPEFVQPGELHAQDADASSPSSISQASLPRRTGSIDSTSTSASLSREQFLRRLSLATSDLQEDSYRPRNTPAKRKKTTTGRITPRSDKHARELELNRKAATKCRNRQKAFIEQLQHRCKREEEKMHIQSSLVSALHDEVVALRNELLRQSFCDCRFLSTASMSTRQ